MFGWFFIVFGVLNTIRGFILIANNVDDVGGILLFAILFLILGLWMVFDAGKSTADLYRCFFIVIGVVNIIRGIIMIVNDIITMGLLNSIRNFVLTVNNVDAVGGIIFWGIVFIVVGIWMVNDTGKDITKELSHNYKKDVLKKTQ